jgi:predicted DNA-binding transcriptional regulator YafY
LQIAAAVERTERFYYIHRQLKSGKCLPMQHFLDALEVSRATFKRDVEYLRDRYGAPVVWDSMERGYRYSQAAGDPAFELPGLWFSPDELHALMTMHALIEQMGGGFLSDQMAAVRDRVAGLLGGDEAGFQALRERVRIFSTGQRRAQADCLPVLARALVERRRLRMTYGARSTDEITEREVSPQRLIHYRGNWYLDAWCHVRKGPRAFAVDAVRAAVMTEAEAREVAVAELERSLGATYGIFSGRPAHWAELRFDTHTSRWIRDEIWHPQQQLRIDRQGRCVLRVPYARETELVMDILRHGAAVEVLSPKALRQRVAAEAGRLAALYVGG